MELLATDHWYDFRDLSNLSRVILEGIDKVAPYELAYIVAPIIGFVAAFVIFVLPSQLFVGVYGERRIIGRIQSRKGPNRVGPFGLLQPVADALKLLQKEALTPTAADKTLMWAAPVFFVAPAVLLFAVIPFGPRMVFADVPAGLIFFIAVSGLPVLAAFIAGWSSNNKYSLYGAMRIVAMSVSYEVPLVLMLLCVVVFTNTMSLPGIVWFQKDVDLWLIFMQPLAFVVYFIAVSAELNRTPTDIAEAESEIVAGYLTEYSGMKWGLFYGMDIGYALAASAFAATIFLGGWSMWGLEQWVPPWVIFIAKTHLFYMVFIWTRGTLPRLRIDQLMGFAWKFLLPLAVVNLFLVSLERLWWSESDLGGGIVFVIAAINIPVSAVAVYLWARFLGYKPERVPTRPRLVQDAGGYVPVEDPATGGGK
ncbi:MAG: NADH-quinone oxidoreductase subunit NuoH [Chloroflexi bacterium]|nr:NADH-quinone oxidoreductase subunit NuoH [Chloroflexota bacterium]